MRKDFNIDDVLGFGWQVMKANFWYFAGVGLLWGFLTFLPDILRGLLEESIRHQPIFFAPYLFLTLLDILISVLLGIGMLKIGLSFCDQVKPGVSTLVNGFDCFWRFLGTQILYVLIVLAGFLLLIIPGIIWAVKYQYCIYFVVDKRLGPIDALRASARTTQTIKLKLFGFGILCSLINMAGVICLLLGIFVTYPVVLVASALVYRHLLIQTPELAEFGIYPSQGPAEAMADPSGGQVQNFTPELPERQ